MRKLLLLTCLICLVGLTSMAPAVNVYFSDSFSRSGTQPAGWNFNVTDPDYWQVGNGWLNSGNGDDLILMDPLAWAIVDVPGSDNWENCTVSCRFWMAQANGRVHLLGRWQSVDNHRRLELAVQRDSMLMRIVDVTGGNETVLASQPVETASLGLVGIANGSEDQAISMSFTLEGSNLVGRLAGQSVVQARDPRIVSGSAGLGQSRNQVYFDDFLVSDVASAAGDAIGVIYHVPVGQSLDQDAANALMERAGNVVDTAVMLRGGQGDYIVLVGNFLSRSEAESAKAQLEQAGISTLEIQAESRGVAEPAVSSDSASTIYRVQLSSTPNLSSAQSVLEALRRQGYFPVMRREGENYNVLIGRFVARDEATKMRARMVSEGFSLARVVEIKPGDDQEEAPAGATKVAQPVPSTVLESSDWQDLTPAQQEQVIQLLATRQASRQEMQTTQEILELKKMVQNLDEKQKEIIVNISEAEDQEAKRQKDIRRLIMQVDRKRNEGDYDGALALLDRLEQIDPTSPIPGIRRERIQHEMHGTFPGSDVLEKKQREELERLAVRADQLANSASLVELRRARELYHEILAKNPGDELVTKANRQIEHLANTIAEMEKQQREKAQAAEKTREMIFWGAIAGIVLLFVVVVFFVYVTGRRRYAHMLQQLQDEAIAPLQQLRAESKVLPSSEVEGIDYDNQNMDLLEQAEDSDADFMIAEADEDGTDEAFPGLSDEEEVEPSFSEAEAGEPEVVAEETETPAAEEAPSEPEVAPEMDEDDDFMMSFDSTEEEETPASESASNEKSAEEDDELVFSFDEGSADEPQESSPAITAAEVSDDEKPEEEDELVFSFDDTMSGLDDDDTSVEPSAEGKEEDSMFDSMELDDLELDLGGSDLDQDEKTAVPVSDGEEESNPLMDDLDVDFEDTVVPGAEAPAAEATPEPEKVEAPASEPAASGDAGQMTTLPDSSLFALAISNSAGSKPEGWNGEDKDYASFTVAEDPSGSGEKCLLFKKTAGEGPTSYSMSFPDAKGRLSIEFDIRCDEKNKHLLGFYVEQDGDFRRSVHTVVQCVDPTGPAHLRIFTRPTPYKMGEWRHIQYMVDLDEGLVDGYEGGNLVAEGVRMGAKASGLNTFSIRDNSNTTGVLYLKNIQINQAPQEA